MFDWMQQLLAEISGSLLLKSYYASISINKLEFHLRTQYAPSSSALKVDALILALAHLTELHSPLLCQQRIAVLME